MSKYRDKIFQRLVSIPSYYPHVAGIKRCQHFIERTLIEIKNKKSTIEIIQGNIIFTIESSNNNETVAILLHYDTTPPFEESVTNDLDLIKKNGYYYGLGVTSAKAAIASIISALKANKDRLPSKNLKVIFSCDETIGSINGTRNLVKNYLKQVSADLYWIPDSTDSYLSIGTYNVVSVCVKLAGNGGHPAYGDIPEEKKVLTSVKHLLTLINENFKLIENKYFDKKLKPKLSITGVKSFERPNIIPASAEIYLDLRLPPDKSDVKDTVSQLLADLKKEPLLNSLDVDYYNGFSSEQSSEIFKEFIHSVQKTIDNKIKTNVELGSHDGAFYGYKLKKPVIGFLPGGKNLHAKDECVPERSLDNIEKLFKHFFYE